MKYFFAFTIACCFFFACKREVSGEGEKFVRCTSCSYLPVCDSSQFVYVDSAAAGADTTESTMAILGDTSINGRKYQKVTAFASFNEGLLYNCDGGDYRIYQRVPNLGINIDSLMQALVQQIGLPFPIGPVQVPSYIETTILKSNAAAGTAWSDTVFKYTPNPLFRVVAKLDYKIEEKNVQRTVFATTYNNVIHVSSKLNISIPLVTPPNNFAVDYYFANNVGMIEAKVMNNGMLQAQSKLYSYKIK